MGKNKLARWAELNTFINVIQPETSDVKGQDHSIKGNWRNRIFNNSNPLVLELACGKGEYTLGLAEIFPERNFVGIDIKGARMWRGAKTANEKGFKNTAFLRTRIEFINSFFNEDEADEIWIVFPDPHPGAKNSNKRLTSPWFLNKYRHILKDGGIIHLKTDNTELFRYTENIVRNNNLEILSSTQNIYAQNTDSGPDIRSILSEIYHTEDKLFTAERILAIRTHYEKIFLDTGSNISYLAFRIDKNRPVNEKWEQNT